MSVRLLLLPGQGTASEEAASRSRIAGRASLGLGRRARRRGGERSKHRMPIDKEKSGSEITCEVCRDTGIVAAKDVESPREMGRFCSACDAGRKRWEATLRLIGETEYPKQSIGNLFAQA